MPLHIISVGGSLIVPEEIDTGYLSAFKQFVLERISRGERFILIAGGGRVARQYQRAAAHVSTINDEEKDWLGIHATRLNAHLLRMIFKQQAHPQILTNLDNDPVDFQESILIGAGWKPGWSTDYIAVRLAEHYKGRSLINLSNIEYVYAEDPRINPEAKRYERMSWDDFRAIVGATWSPGLSAPFDPIASQAAARLGLSVAIMHGKNLANLGHYLNGESFCGTLIQEINEKKNTAD